MTYVAVVVGIDYATRTTSNQGYTTRDYTPMYPHVNPVTEVKVAHSLFTPNEVGPSLRRRVRPFNEPPVDKC